MRTVERTTPMRGDVSLTSWKNLFMRRLRTWLADDWKTLRTAVDWVIAIYFIVPGLIAAGLIYAAWWREPPPWLAYIPYEIMIVLVFVSTLSFSVRTFLEPADEVFLQQHRSALNVIRRLGLAYSLTVAALAAAGLFFVLSPLLVRGYGMSPADVGLLAAYTYLWKLIVPPAVDIFRFRMSGWRSRIARGAVIVTGGLLFLASSHAFHGSGSALRLLVECLCVAGAGSAAFGIVRARLREPGALRFEIERERRARMRLTSFLLARSGIKEDKSALREKRPLIFRRSQPLTGRRDKRAVLMESVIKSCIRSSDQWFFLAKYMWAAVTALALTPGWIGFIVYGGLMFLLYQGVRFYCTIAVNSSYLDLFRWTKEERLVAVNDAVWRISLPAAVILLIVLLATY